LGSVSQNTNTGIHKEYLDRKGRKWQEAGEECIMWNFKTCTQGGDGGHVAHMGEMTNSYKIVVGKPLRRPRRRW